MGYQGSSRGWGTKARVEGGLPDGVPVAVAGLEVTEHGREGRVCVVRREVDLAEHHLGRRVIDVA